ncbi:MAG: DJ-1/PfpI family protein [Nitrospirae bacterium]|nr:DJ-1/PfpI family protein [Nitrospirota bacterium]
MALPESDFDPTEVSVPWSVLTAAGYEVKFATPSGKRGHADPRVLTGKGFGPFKPFLAAREEGRELYGRLEKDPAFGSPISYEQIAPDAFDGLILPGGHAPGMKPYLESPELQKRVAHFFEADKPAGAICHGVLIPARVVSPKTGRSVLYGRKTTALLKSMELSGWAITAAWLGNYIRTYPTPVEDEVRSVLKSRDDFIRGPMSLRRDSASRPERGFAVVDGNYVSARWPGDANRFAREFLRVLDNAGGKGSPRTGTAMTSPG